MNVHLNIAATNGDHIQKAYGTVVVTLSRRNVLALLRKLERDEEEGMEAVRTLMRNQGDGLFLAVVIEPDEVHYADREAGEMGSDIEAKLVNYTRAEVDALIQAASDHGEALAEGKRCGFAVTIESLIVYAEALGRPLPIAPSRFDAGE